MRLSQGQVSYSMMTLPERFMDRIPARDLEDIIRWRDAGEWDLTLAYLIFALHRSRASISEREVRSLCDFLETFQPLDILEAAARLLDEFGVIPSLTDKQMIDRMQAMPPRFAARLPPESIEILTEPPEEDDVVPGQVWPDRWWSDMLEILITDLLQYRVLISEQEQSELWMLLDALNMSRRGLLQLRGT